MCNTRTESPNKTKTRRKKKSTESSFCRKREEKDETLHDQRVLEDDTERTDMTTRHGEAGILEFMQGIQTRRGIKMARVFPGRSCGQNYEMKML